MASDPLALLDHLAGGDVERAAADHGRARAHGAHAEGDAVGVAVDELHLRGVEAEPLVQDLLERGLVPRPCGLVSMSSLAVPVRTQPISAKSKPGPAGCFNALAETKARRFP